MASEVEIAEIRIGLRKRRREARLLKYAAVVMLMVDLLLVAIVMGLGGLFGA